MIDIYRIDGIQGLLAHDSGSVDLVLSDLPSGETEAEFDHAPDLCALFAATWHALKPDGVAVFMASSLRFAAACMAAGDKTYRYDLVWEKSNATGHLNANRQPMRSHEYALVFYRQRGFYAAQMRETGEPSRTGRGAVVQSANYGKTDQRKRVLRTGETTRHPGSVLRFNSVHNGSPLRIHPQQKPDDLLRWLVRSYSRPGDVVVDPFAGSGSTGVAALAEGRRFLGFDTSSRFAPRGAGL